MTAPPRSLAAGRGGATSFWDGASEQSLAAALSPPTTMCVEAELSTVPIDRRSPAADVAVLGLVVTTRAAYRRAIARIFTAALVSRLDMECDLRERVETALQEAIVNAVMHGNLRLETGLRDSLEGLAEMHAVAEQRLIARDCALRRIVIDASWRGDSICVDVCDDGVGHAALPPDQSAVHENASGRGLQILSAMADRLEIGDHGRRITLEFKR